MGVAGPQDSHHFRTREGRWGPGSKCLAPPACLKAGKMTPAYLSPRLPVSARKPTSWHVISRRDSSLHVAPILTTVRDLVLMSATTGQG